MLKPQIGEYLFIYGTLLPECRAYYKLQGKTTLIGSGEIKGAEMYNIGSFPGVILVDDPTKIVHGMVFEIIDEHLPDTLDQYEGYPHLYDRSIVETNHGPAWVYTFNHPVKPEQRIESGNWMKRA